MNPDATSLDRLHDIVLPPEVSWFPVAPGWRVLIILLLLTSLWLARRAWKHWQANAYRRAALRELVSAADASAIAELLRRTALVIAPRHEIAAKTGPAWLDWLAEQSPIPLPETIRPQLTTGIYGRPTESADLTSLRDFAAGWIAQHRAPVTKS